MDPLRHHVHNLLAGKGAHINFQDAIEGFPREFRGKRIPSVPFTAWQILEHMRIAQWDILEFSRNPGHVSPKWPEGYWPKTDAPPDDEAWEQSVRQFNDDLSAMQRLISEPTADLLARIPKGEGQTLLREALLLADHNSYHLGQFVFLRKMLDGWNQ
jgi:hypothetical protein